MRKHPYGTREAEIRVLGIPCIARFSCLPSEPAVGIMGEQIDDVSLVNDRGQRLKWLEKKAADGWDAVLDAISDIRDKWRG
jgi:hypothetical protein